MRGAPLVRSAIALAVLAATGASHAASRQEAAMMAELKRLAERVERLEKRNAELEAKLVAAPAAPVNTRLVERVEALEKQNTEITASLESDRLSEREPELVTRLKAIETKTQSIQQQARRIESLDGISAEANVVAVAQRINGGARADGKSETQLNWRSDIGVALPGGDFGNSSGQFFAQVRLGQGEGVSADRRTPFTGAFNSTAFELGNPDGERNRANSTALLAQAWYQLNVPLPLDGFADASKEHLEITVGKIDPFVFFDQNAIADNEAEKFLNNVFVHNPMLDSGGAVGADDYGFSPGVRVAYHSEQAKPETWQVSLGAFGAGEGATFGKSFTQPFVIGQLEFGRKLFGGLDGTYRVYAWRNGQYEGFDGETGTTTGWGASVDQRVSSDLTLFARYGHTAKGKAAFDRAVTVGGELTGNMWGRGADGMGLAFAWLRSSKSFRDATAADPDFDYVADGAEQIAELYYRWYFNDHLTLTPDLQYLRHAGADKDAKDVTTVGVRALYAF